MELIYFKKFKELVTQNDQRPYLLDDEKTVSYAELYVFACSIEKKLAGFDLINSEVIALCFDSKFLQIVATWGCIFSEHPFFPINLKSSPDRLVQASKYTRIVLTDSLLLSKKYKAESNFEIEEIHIDEKNCLYLIKYESSESIQEILKYPGAFYLMQTSGSTGLPKVVIHNAESAYTFAAWAADYLKINEEDKLLSISPLFFDMSVFDLFTSAIAKCSLKVPEPSIFMFPRDFSNSIHNGKITTLYLTPGLLQKLILHYPQFPSLRRVILAGEDFDKVFLNKVKIISPDVKIYNFYGPTETNVCLFKELTKLNEVVIGETCPYSSVILYDRVAQASSESFGEILVSGISVALGYLDQNFTDDKISIKGIEYYKTGDLAKVTSDGFKFLGRHDHQVKISGYRISLMEVESYIHDNLNSYSAKALLHEEKLYVIIWGDISLEKKSELHSMMKKELPSYMVPYKIFSENILDQESFSDNLKVTLEKLIVKLIEQEKINYPLS